MIDDHCKVKLSGFTVPLIGVPADSGLEECDCCHDRFQLWTIKRVDPQWLCPKCRATQPGTHCRTGS